ncbi:hypothetical protein Dalk_5247 [Desulfatibacillum aliphaticivorans]|uniref:HTH cro/C1-type domain-containing protein n=1 Tax=Desulfatibacillum aliphaticivorans TaxID=218208 RepID=B8FED6_DESAL|nr:helix-turn-helix transcriptional regulator [Desulfatibacillum aliphaticivorans]ACL06917.1 hypothetical protein Dalk_5247 [Desulfatibacillum aliphaticivorans]
MNHLLRILIVENYGTQADFASKVGTDETIVSRVLRGRRTLPADKQAVWAKALNCTIPDIFPEQ